jgi:quercetin dioxygenase-like cupin family protein
MQGRKVKLGHRIPCWVAFFASAHTHPGIESSYVLEGSIELPVEGQPTRIVKAGDVFQIPPYTPHAGGKPTDAKVRVSSTYVVEKGKPLASQA